MNRDDYYKAAIERLKSVENMIGDPFYNLNKQEKVEISIRIQKDVPPARFRPDPLNPGGWIANELTFRAMKKDIFAQEHLDDLHDPYICNSCKHQIDKQFWVMCPFCGTQFN